MGFWNWYLSLRGEETLVRQLSDVKECHETEASAEQVPGEGPDAWYWALPAASDEEIPESLSDIKIRWSRDNLDRHPPTLCRVISNLDININSLMTVNRVQTRPGRGQIAQYATSGVRGHHPLAISPASPHSGHLYHKQIVNQLKWMENFNIKLDRKF